MTRYNTCSFDPESLPFTGRVPVGRPVTVSNRVYPWVQRTDISFLFNDCTHSRYEVSNVPRQWVEKGSGTSCPEQQDCEVDTGDAVVREQTDTGRRRGVNCVTGRVSSADYLRGRFLRQITLDTTNRRLRNLGLSGLPAGSRR